MHCMYKALLSLDIIVKNFLELDVPYSVIFQFLDILIDEEILINKLRVLKSHGVDQDTIPLAEAGHSVQAESTNDDPDNNEDVSTLREEDVLQQSHQA